jgi:peroxiredoxin
VELQSHLKRFEAAGAELWAITGDDPKRVKAFWEAESLGMMALSDPTGSTFESYGIRNLNHKKTVPHPTVIVLDTEGRVRFVVSDDNYKVRPPSLAVVSAVENLEASSD